MVPPRNAEVVIAPPSLYLLLAREHLSKNIEVAAQNVFDKPNGAFTGEISTEQLKVWGFGWLLRGLSERRVILGEDDGVSVCGAVKRGTDSLVQEMSGDKASEYKSRRGRQVVLRNG